MALSEPLQNATRREQAVREALQAESETIEKEREAEESEGPGRFA